MILAMGMTIVYIIFRGIFTLNLESAYSTFASWLLYSAEILGGFQMLLYFFNVWEVDEPDALEPEEGLTVDVLIPTYNEDVLLLRGTVQAALAMDYEHRTIILDDGRRPEVAELADELGAMYIKRDDNKHAKAGNMNNALEQLDGEYVIVLDADHVPVKHMITRLLGYFRDPKVGFVQSPHDFYNFENFQASCNYDKQQYWEEGLLFYHNLQPGKNRCNAVVFAGSAAMFRRTALDDVGLFAVETITEDMHTGLRMAAKGWKSISVTERLIAGQAAPDVTTFHTQRLRWGEGNVSILFHDNPLTMRGLTLTQRISYWASIFHWFSGFTRLAVYATPILLLLTGVAPFTEIKVWIITMLLSYLFITHLAMRLVSGKNASLHNMELFAMMTFWTSIKGCFRGIFKRKDSTFVVTSKRGGRQAGASLIKFIMPQIMIIGFGFAALAWASFRMLFHTTYDFIGPSIAAPLVLYHIVLAWMVLRRSIAEETKRFSYRHKAILPVEFTFDDPEHGTVSGLGMSSDFSEYGIGLITYEPLPIDGEGDLFLSADGERYRLRGAIRHSDASAPDDLAIDGSQPTEAEKGTYRYGIEFLELTPETADALSRLALNYAVPLIYQWFSSRRSKTRQLAHRVAHLLTWKRRREERKLYRLPLELVLPSQIEGEPGPCIRTVTEDISRKALRILLPQELDEDAHYPFVMPSPLGRVEGQVQILRSTVKEFGSLKLYEYVLEYTSFVEQSRGMLYDLLSPIDEKRIESALVARNQEQKAPIFQPVAVGILSAMVLIPGGLVLFRTVNTDDIFLLSASEDIVLSRADLVRVEEIYESSLSGEPKMKQLDMLSEILLREGRRQEVEDLIRRMLEIEPDNLGLTFALGNSHAAFQRVDEADDTFQHVLAELDKDLVNEVVPRRNVLLSGARNFFNAGRIEESLIYFAKLKEGGYQDDEILDEHAAAYLAGGHLDEAIAIYQASDSSTGMHMLLASIHNSRDDFASAETECRIVLKLDPGHEDALHLLAQVLTWQKRYKESSDVYEQIAAAYPEDGQMAVRLAELALWDGNYALALLNYQVLVDGDIMQRSYWKGYLSAAVGMSNLSREQKATVLAIENEAGRQKYSDAAFKALLASVMQNMGEKEKAMTLLTEALKLDPTRRSSRMQLADLLSDMGDFEEADRHYQMLLD